MNGFMGKILLVDLSKGKIEEKSLDESVYRQYMGGYGLGIYHVMKNMKHGVDPLGTENILGFCPGLFTGSVAPLAGRCMVCGKSPLTGGWGDANVGGFIGMAIKRAGYDAIFFKGISKEPVYLVKDGGEPELVDAGRLWGCDSIETERLLKEKHGKRCHVAAIGPGGENLLRFSAIVTSGGRVAGRSGFGAVMGSKKLKAICLGGTRKVGYHDKQAAVSLVKAYTAALDKMEGSIGAKFVTRIGTSMGKMLKILKMPMVMNQPIATRVFRNFGTAFATSIQVLIGDSPVKNFSGIGAKDFPDKAAQQFNCENMDKWITGHQGCFGCPIQCGHVMKVPELNMERTHRPEYETLSSFGPLLLNQDILKVIEVNEYCNRMGIDTISTGVIVAFIMECSEKGLLDRDAFKCDRFPDGFVPGWNKPGTIMPLLEMMVSREGFGAYMAEGLEKLAAHVGGDAMEFAMVINGQEVPMHDPRMDNGLIVTYLSDPTPARHTAACLGFTRMGEVNKFLKGFKIKSKISKGKKYDGRAHAKWSKFVQATNALGLCQYSYWFATYPLLEFFKSIVGWNMSIKEFNDIGWRIQLLRHLFNAREGKVRFTVPRRVLGIPPFEAGPLKGVTLDPREAILDYFDTLGLDARGVPTRE
ncbi:MAG: aldehyde ferredoxin oxidoreductase family protein, partial [Promethearchaeota archaeon]